MIFFRARFFRFVSRSRFTRNLHNYYIVSFTVHQTFTRSAEIRSTNGKLYVIKMPLGSNRNWSTRFFVLRQLFYKCIWSSFIWNYQLKTQLYSFVFGAKISGIFTFVCRNGYFIKGNPHYYVWFVKIAWCAFDSNDKIDTQTHKKCLQIFTFF